MMIKCKIELLCRYLKYLFIAKHSSGHGIHSPFIFEFVTSVLFVSDKNKNYIINNTYRKELCRDKRTIDIIDKGAGSMNQKSPKRRINDVVRTSSIKSKYGKLLARIVAFYKPINIIELGTSLGISSTYLALNLQSNGKLFTIEGDKNLFQIAKQNLSSKFNKEIFPIYGNFEGILPELLNQINELDLIFFDGNHRKEPTIFYFELCLKKITNQTVFIFDDIHWSSEMEEAWEYIKSHSETRVCIDLFQIGIVFFRKELSCENYIIKF